MTYFICLLVMLVGSPMEARAAVKIDQTTVSIIEFKQSVSASGFITEAELIVGVAHESGLVS